MFNSCNRLQQAFKTLIRHASTERSLNRVTLIGRAGADAQLKGTYEHPVVNFSLATTSGPKTEWHKISVFRDGLRSVAENYVKSGARLFVEGRLSYGHIIDAQGNTTPITTIIAEDIVFLSRSSKASGDVEELEMDNVEKMG